MALSLGWVRVRSELWHGRVPGRSLRSPCLGAAIGAVAVVLLLGLSVVTVPQAAHAGAVGVKDYTRVATDLSEDVCARLGRAWATVDGLTGCSRTRCARSDARITGDYNAETCTLGGAPYAVNLESRTCRALHRTWVPQVNRCLANVDLPSVDGLVEGAPQCDNTHSTYIRLPRRAGPDLCVLPPAGQQYVRQARRQRTSVADIAFSDSRVSCDLAPSHDWVRGACRRLHRGEVKRRPTTRVLVIGDSVTWRAADEMTQAQPGWVVDGQPGTSAASFDRRYADALAIRRAPRTLVFALGTNDHPGMTRASFERRIALAPTSSRVVLVTPYRSAEVYGRSRARFMHTTARWFEQIARQRPRTCVADWRATVEQDPDLTIDGVHETTQGEKVFADLVARAVARCR